MAKAQRHTNFWSEPPNELFRQLDTTPQGITSAQAEQRLKIVGPNTVQQHKTQSTLSLFLRQFKDPLVLILFFAASVSLFVGEWVDAIIIILIIISSGVLSFIQEYNATTAVEKLLARVQVKATVLRDGIPVAIPVEAVVPGDVVFLKAGSLIPGDGVIIEENGCYVDQAALTGETFPVEKKVGVVKESASITERTNSLFMGTSIRSGTATMLVVQTGAATAYGQIAERLTLRPPETEFERGIRRFSHLLSETIVLMVLFVFAVNVFAQKPPVDSLLFAIALAVGMAPELLPAIITVTLSQGAQQMAKQGVIVRRLSAIENFGNMDVLCTDKTGTLTESRIFLDAARDVDGHASNIVLQDAYLNASFQVGIASPLDEAIVAYGKDAGLSVSTYRKLDEVPYDFVRKRLTVAVQDPDGQTWIITKGALDKVLEVCTQVDAGDTVTQLDAEHRDAIQRKFTEWSSQGFRVLGLATKLVNQQTTLSRADEYGLTFRGFLSFVDPPKKGVREALASLAQLGVHVKIITGDNRQVTQHIADQVGLAVTGVLAGTQLNELRDEALMQLAERTNLFVEVDPNQKERIIHSLQIMGHIVGYMGDGINDAPALHSADVGISVDQAADVAKEAADFVLLENDLAVLHAGIVSGRRTFANTIKYVYTTTSANFGNMFSMAGLSVFLSYLPLLPKQILLNNFLSDIPGMAIAGDEVDPEWIETPHRWDVKVIRNFMVLFGLVSSVFDYLTFAVLLWIVNATPEQFRTGWFIESLMSELVIALVVRTRRPFYQSKPGRGLRVSTLAVAVLTLLLPYLSPINTLFEFVPLSLSTMLLLMLITALYVVAAEVAKKIFYSRV